MDQERIAELYAAHVPAMRRLAFLMLHGDRDRAEDVVHDAFIRSAGRLPQLRDADRFEAYFRRSVMNGVMSHGRRRRVELNWLHRESGAFSDDITLDPLDDVVANASVLELLASLPERQRLAVTARICLDLSEQQTAALLGCSVGTVKSLTSRGLASLRAKADSDKQIGTAS